MQRNTTSNNTLRRSLLATFLGLALSGLAYAQTVVTSPETSTVMGRAPVVSTATINVTPSGAGGQVLAGDVLTANFLVTDPDTDTIDTAATSATVQWTVDGTPVGSAGSMTYTVQAADAGKVITYRLVPHTDPGVTDPYQGVLTIAADVGADGSGGGTGPGGGGEINPADPTALLSVAVTPSGNPIVDTVLTATPTCVATCGAGITYQWQIETASGSGTYTDIAGATGATYTPKKDDQKKKIKVVATAP
ncbi:ZirU family protein [Noviluteimonas gilva]|uniref:Invasin family protein n=1 Tax=Noviluteimonas gilva TaxID=2682097 RepID=A0A7C9HK76_9GAMM|nr:ZirU family protein [Lysobacter gilvus]MUV12652.1 invasin family protein [Lysobacter gilvus]